MYMYIYIYIYIYIIPQWNTTMEWAVTLNFQAGVFLEFPACGISKEMEFPWCSRKNHVEFP